MYFMNTIFDTTLMEGVRTMSKNSMADLNGLKTDLTMVEQLSGEGWTMLGQKCEHETYQQTYTLDTRNTFTCMISYTHSSHVQSCTGLYGIVNEDILLDTHRVVLTKHYCFKRLSKYKHNEEENLHSLSLILIKYKIFCLAFQVFLLFFCTALGTSLDLHDKSLFRLRAWANLSQTEGVL